MHTFAAHSPAATIVDDELQMAAIVIAVSEDTDAYRIVFSFISADTRELRDLRALSPPPLLRLTTTPGFEAS
jgi:hypothetical protein